MKKLDPRIKDRKYIFDCFNADEAKKYIGKKCYMTDYFERFEDVEESTAKCTLGKIDEDGFFIDGEDDFRFTYCLPMELVAPKEKVFRPYTLDDFSFHIGDLIKFRTKDNHNFEIGTMYLGYIKNNGAVKVLLGNDYFSLKELFACYEWYNSDSNTWEMFGVEEK